jgi:hypothetical protein
MSPSSMHLFFGSIALSLQRSHQHLDPPGNPVLL